MKFNLNNYSKPKEYFWLIFLPCERTTNNKILFFFFLVPYEKTWTAYKHLRRVDLLLIFPKHLKKGF